jgi:hypothetical protein
MKREGKFMVSALERAKELLSNMEDPDILKLGGDSGLLSELSEEDMMKLKIFIKNHKSKAAKVRA